MIFVYFRFIASIGGIGKHKTSTTETLVQQIYTLQRHGRNTVTSKRNKLICPQYRSHVRCRRNRSASARLHTNGAGRLDPDSGTSTFRRLAEAVPACLSYGIFRPVTA